MNQTILPPLLKPLDDRLKELLIPIVQPKGGPKGAIRFQAPDEKLRSYVGSSYLGTGAFLLDVYLAEVRENRSLQSTEGPAPILTQNAAETVPAAYLDCHYLITAWARAQITFAQDPTPTEHDILYRVAQTLFHERPLTVFDDIPLFTDVAPPIESPTLRDFWATMGAASRWKPAVHLVVTLPVLTPPKVAPEASVRTVVTSVVRADSGEVIVEIGGLIANGRTGAVPVPVTGARVSFTPKGSDLGHTSITDDRGRYRVTNLSPGAYRMSVEAPALGEEKRAVVIPGGIGDYDITYD